MSNLHDPENGTDNQLWPAPAGSTPILDINAERNRGAARRPRRRQLALGALAVAAIAGGTLGEIGRAHV